MGWLRIRSWDWRGDGRSGWFIFLPFSCYYCTTSHLCDILGSDEGVYGICGDIFGFQKASAFVCVVIWSIPLPIYLYILRGGGQISTMEI